MSTLFSKKNEKFFSTSFYIYLNAVKGAVKYMPAHCPKNTAPAMKGSNEIRKKLI